MKYRWSVGQVSVKYRSSIGEPPSISIDRSIGRYIGRYWTDISTCTRSSIDRYSAEYRPMYRPIYRPIYRPMYRSRPPIRYMIRRMLLNIWEQLITYFQMSFLRQTGDWIIITNQTTLSRSLRLNTFPDVPCKKSCSKADAIFSLTKFRSAFLFQNPWQKSCDYMLIVYMTKLWYF